MTAFANGNATASIYAREFGGSDGDFPAALTIDSNGCTYVAGYTFSTNFPGATPRIPVSASDADIFVTKLNTNGDVMFSKVLGGSGYDRPAAIAVDPSGNVYLTGRTTSTNFPVVNAAQSLASSNGNVFIVKLDANFAVVYSTYLGGGSYDEGVALAITGNAEAVIVGRTGSSDFPATPGAFQSQLSSGGSDDLSRNSIPPATTCSSRHCLADRISTTRTLSRWTASEISTLSEQPCLPTFR